ncbi:ABC transporter permease [Spiractinospora alimapuensis]|uniref:ABC transporter permease n=1 Tax=Spiractinospora alimapuensis TaxID=2820884 RepID=UPI001F388D0B|nr:ABC transporter permease [Spiractinospora alimapuensis]QVQ52761.1 ABC transporter permease [Spiractinospora alimapuensis]
MSAVTPVAADATDSGAHDASASAPVTAPRPLGRRLLHGLLPWASVIALLLTWYLGAVTGVLSPNVLPGPDRVLSSGWGLLQQGLLLPALGVSLGRVLLGAALGIVVGVGCGLITGFSRVGEALIDKPFQMARTIPFTALVPLFILWFGLGELPKVLLVAVGVALPLYINTFGGVRDVDRKLVEAAKVYRLTPLQIATQVLLPGALPSLLVGLRYALGLAWVAVIIAETVNSDAGIGFLLINAQQYIQTDVVMFCVTLYAVLGLITDRMVRSLERVLLAWRNSFTGL